MYQRMQRTIHISILLGILLFTNTIFAQGLNESWEKIQQSYNEADYDAVLADLPAFISTLESNAMNDKLILPYFYMGIAQLHKGLLPDAETSFDKAREYATQTGQTQLIGAIDNDRMKTLMDLAEKLKNEDPSLAEQFYDAIIKTAKEQNNATILVASHYTKAVLVANQNRSLDAITELEQAMPNLSSVNPSQAQLVDAVKSMLYQLYIQEGMTDKAANLNSGEGESGKIDAAIRFAQDMQNNGNYTDADAKLLEVQNLILQEKDAEFVENFLKMRLSLLRNVGAFSSSPDTLNAIINNIANLSLNDSKTPFIIGKLYVLVCLETGRLDDAHRIMNSMTTQINDGSFPQNLTANYYLLKGDVAYLEGAFKDAIAAYNQVITDITAITPAEKLALFNNNGLAHYKTGEYEKSLEFLNLLYDNATDENMLDYKIQADLNAGIVLIKQTEFEKALDRFKRAREEATTSKKTNLEIMANLRLAETYRFLGFDKISDETFRNVKRKYRELENPHTRIQLANALAAYEKSVGDIESAKKYLEDSFQLSKQIGLLSASISTATKLADIYLLEENTKDALDLYAYSYDFLEDEGILQERIFVLLKMGQCYTLQNKFDSSFIYIDKAINNLVFNYSGDYLTVDLTDMKDIYLFAISLTSLSNSHYLEGLKNNDIKLILKAFDEIERAVDILEKNFYSQMLAQKRSSEEWNKNINSFHLYIEIANTLYKQIQDKTYLAKAFNTNEKLRSQTFILEVGQQLVSRINDPAAQELALLTESQDITESSVMTLDLTNGVSSTRGLTVKKDKSKNVFGEQDKYDQLVSGLKETKSSVASLVSINTLTLSAVQDFLTPDDLLINYLVSDNTLYIFGINNQDAVLEEVSISESELSKMVETYREYIQNPMSDEYQTLSAELYNILITPVEELINGKELILIPSGKLHNLPFGSLINNGSFLTASNAITIIPNASFFQFVRESQTLSSKPSLLLVGNPINPSSVEMPQLPGAESEVLAIKKIYPQATVLVRDDATEYDIKRAISGYEIAHFACHGLFNYDYPLLSALALAENQTDDGRWELHEIYNVDMSHTNLVIMSACETGLAQIKKNDDMVGLVRGFLNAGVPSVIASLWKVDDNATFKLMSRFYHYLSLGFNKAEALKRSQNELIESPNFNHPFYWAAFGLNGYGK